MPKERVEIKEAESAKTGREKLIEFKERIYGKFVEEVEYLFNLSQEVREKLAGLLKSDNVTVKDLVNAYKTVAQTMESLVKLLPRLFPPADIVDNEEVVEIVSLEENESDAIKLRKVLWFHLNSLLKVAKRLENDMRYWDVQSVEFWKVLSSFLSVSERLKEIIARLDKLNEKGAEESVELTMEEIFEAYDEIAGEQKFQELAELREMKKESELESQNKRRLKNVGDEKED